MLLLLVVFASFNTILLGFQIASRYEVSPGSSFAQSGSSQPGIFQTPSVYLAPASWAVVVGVWWAWRGKTKSEWDRNGLSRGVFELMVRMKGSESRTSLLKELSVAKDRNQLAKDLNLDWKTVDHHVNVLLEHGLIREYSVYGNVKLFELTDIGRTVLEVLGEFKNPENPQLGNSD